MNITLESEEAALLANILVNHLSNLRMEIVDTEDYDLRQTLKHNEAVIKRLLERLGRTGPTYA